MSSAIKVHGMDGSLVEPDWPALDLAEVRALLSQYPGFGEPIEILFTSPRPLSAASVVATSGGRVFIKRHHRSVRDQEGLQEEHRFMAHLLAHGAHVPRVFSASSGETAIALGDWTYEVHQAAKGVDLYGEALSWTPFRTVAHAHSAGQALARLHLAAEGFAAGARKPQALVASFTIFAAQDPRAEMKRYVATRPALAGYLSTRDCCEQALDFLAPFHTQLWPLLPALPPLWTHNDLHGSNMLWSDAGDDAQARTVIDFGLADRTNAVHDLAHAIERSIVEWLALVADPAHPEAVPVHLDHLAAMLDGYETVRRLSEEEAAALAPMAALCHAEFALSETDYLLSVLHREDLAPMACEGWLVGHARWFRSEGGKRLLDAIGHWVQMRGTQTRKTQGDNRP